MIYGHAENIQSLISELAEQKQQLLLSQLNDLVSRGLLVVEEGPSSLVRSAHSDKIEYVQTIKLTLKDKEYIQSLESKVKELEKKLETISQALTNVPN